MGCAATANTSACAESDPKTLSKVSVCVPSPLPTCTCLAASSTRTMAVSLPLSSRSFSGRHRTTTLTHSARGAMVAACCAGGGWSLLGLRATSLRQSHRAFAAAPSQKKRMTKVERNRVTYKRRAASNSDTLEGARCSSAAGWHGRDRDGDS